MERQERNLVEAKRKKANFDVAFDKDMATLKPDWVVPPSFYKERIDTCTAILSRCDAMLKDLAAHSCPDADPRVRSIRSWVEATRVSLVARQRELQPKSEPPLEWPVASIP